MDVGFKTDKGVTRYNNEDACFVMIEENVFIIADGVGGNKSGEIASRTATRLVAEYISKNPPREDFTEIQVNSYFQNCLNTVNCSVLENSLKFDQNQGMATTIVVGYVCRNKLYVFNVGDSRAYIYRKGDLRQITEDHTYVNTLVKAGIITPAEAETHEKRHMITKAMGAEPVVDADLFIEDLEIDDVVILCTDGLYGEVSSEEIISYIERGNNMSETCSDLVDLANLNGGGDNITIICLRYTKEDCYEQ